MSIDDLKLENTQGSERNISDTEVSKIVEFQCQKFEVQVLFELGSKSAQVANLKSLGICFDILLLYKSLGGTRLTVHRPLYIHRPLSSIRIRACQLWEALKQGEEFWADARGLGH